MRRLMRATSSSRVSPVVAINSGGPANLAINVALILVLLLILARLARPGLSVVDGRPIVVCGRRGFLALCLYLILLYGVTYRFLRPEALPSAPIQLLTFVFYAIAIIGLARHRARDPLPAEAVKVDPREKRLVWTMFASVLLVGFALSCIPVGPSPLRPDRPERRRLDAHRIPPDGGRRMEGCPGSGGRRRWRDSSAILRRDRATQRNTVQALTKADLRLHRMSESGDAR